MAQATGLMSIRECAREMIDTLARNRDSVVDAETALAAPIQELLRRPDLLELGVKRDGNHTGDSLWLYYDYDLLMFTFRVEQGVSVPVHNHGTWEVIAMYRGALKYTMFCRQDDGSRPYHADLEVVEDRVMLPGELSICPPPPHDVHGFTALTDDTYAVAVVGGHYAPVRQYYHPSERYYIERGQQVWRLGGKG